MYSDDVFRERLDAVISALEAWSVRNRDCATVEIAQAPTYWKLLGDGYRVSVRIVTLSEAKAVQVPVSAVFPLPASAQAAA